MSRSRRSLDAVFMIHVVQMDGPLYLVMYGSRARMGTSGRLLLGAQGCFRFPCWTLCRAAP